MKNNTLLSRVIVLTIITFFNISTTYSQVITSKFKPISFEERIAPYQEYIRAYKQAEKEFEENYISAIQEMNSPNPNNHVAIFNLSKCISLNERYEYNLFNDQGELLYKRAACYKKTNQLDKSNESFFAASYWYGNNKQYNKAIECCNFILEHGYNDAVTFCRALYYGCSNNQEASNRDYNSIITSGSSDDYILAMSYNNLAYESMKHNKYDDATTLVNKALQVTNNISTIWDTRGELYYHLHKYEECILDMNVAISIEKGEASYGNSYYYRGLAELKLDKKPSAKRDLRRAVKYGNNNAQRILSSL